MDTPNRQANNIASSSHQGREYGEIVGNIATPVKTRWNYQLRTVSEVLKIPTDQLDLANSLSKSTRNMNLSEMDRLLLKEFVYLMDEYGKVTDEMQGDDALVSQVAPAINSLRMFTKEYIKADRQLKKVIPP